MDSLVPHRVLCEGRAMGTLDSQPDSTLELTRSEMEKAASLVKRHARDEEDLSYLLDALGLAV